MGWAQLKLLLDYKTLRGQSSTLASLMAQGNTGYSVVDPFGALVAESGASATAIATGVRVANRSLSQQPDGSALPTILELARKRGRRTGLVTTGRLTHATSAAFLAHSPNRDRENEIADQIIDSGVDILLGGGSRYFPSSRLSALREAGYTVVRSPKELAETNANHLFGVFSPDRFPYRLDRTAEDKEPVPDLSTMTAKALALLQGEEDGFLLVIDCRLVDEAAHNNDAGSVLAEMLELDRTLEVILEATRQNPLLLIVTSNHETGGMGMTYQAQPTRWGGPAEIERIAGQRRSFRHVMETLWRMEKTDQDVIPKRVLQEIRQALQPGITFTEEDAAAVLKAYLSAPVPSPFTYSPAMRALGQALAEEYLIVWSTGTHTSVPVPVFGVGPGAESLRGIHPATHVFETLRSALAL